MEARSCECSRDSASPEPDRSRDVKERTPRVDMAFVQERRSEIRLMCADMVQVHWKPPEGRSRRATALLEDISTSGACLQMESPIPLGSLIRWGSAGQHFEGVVRYCTYREIGYFVGVQFTEGTKWSKEDYQPQHLLDLERLKEQAGK
jgi:hypothetical protein